MNFNFRNFEVTDLFGATWKVEYRWQQNGITIRHADTVDVKFWISDGNRTEEKVVALEHPILLELSRKSGRPLTDAWCNKLAAMHVQKMIETGEDIEKTLVTPSASELQAYENQMQRIAAEELALAEQSH